jgi:hypothetical protein
MNELTRGYKNQKKTYSAYEFHQTNIFSHENPEEASETKQIQIPTKIRRKLHCNVNSLQAKC